MYLKMLSNEDFRKLLVVCLKMLFRKSTRKRFICLVIAFLVMMGFNTFSYVKKFHQTETQKKEILDQRAFKVFFARMRTRNNFERFLNWHYKKLQQFGSTIVKKAFVYQNNLFIHFFTPSAAVSDDRSDSRDAMNLLYSVYHIQKFAGDFFVKDGPDEYTSKVRNSYIDHNGAGLSETIFADRHRTLRFDLIDIADMIRENVWDKRLDVYNSIKTVIIKNMNRVPPDDDQKPNPYLSRVESIIPMNFLHILTNIKYDNTTDIMDLAESVRYASDATIEADKAFMTIPKVYENNVMYADIELYGLYRPAAFSGTLPFFLRKIAYSERQGKKDQ